MRAIPSSYRPVRPPYTATLQEFGAFIARQTRVSQRQNAAEAHDGESRGAVLVIPPLLNGDRHTAGLRGAISHDGYAAFGWELGRDLGPTPKLMAGVEARLLSLFAANGPVSLVGLSMGGLFCRWLAINHPDCVRQVITVCSPFRAPLDSFFLPLRPMQKIWPVPGLAALEQDLGRRLPVPEAAVFSTQDGIVAWESCYDPQRPAECFSFDGRHVTIANDPAVRAIVLDQLNRVSTG